jgi:hypothetical protein
MSARITVLQDRKVVELELFFTVRRKLRDRR